MSKPTLGAIMIGLAIAHIVTLGSQDVDRSMEAVTEKVKINKEVKVTKEEEFVSTIAEMMTMPEEEKKEYIEVKAICTFYTSLASCNGDNLGLTASGKYLSNTSIAIPRKSMPYGTKIEVEGIGTRYADDCGSTKHIRIMEDGTYRFDVYMPRIKGESDSQYKKRVVSYGKLETTAKIYYVKESE